MLKPTFGESMVERITNSTIPIALVLTIALAGCPGRLDRSRFQLPNDGGGVIDVPALFAERCSNVGCHGAGAPLDLTSPDVGARIRDLQSACMMTPLVDPANPEMSWLYMKVSMDMPGCNTPRMPLAPNPQLSTEEQMAIRDWIAGLQ